MRWPWVSRREYDATMRAFTEAVRELDALRAETVPRAVLTAAEQHGRQISNYLAREQGRVDALTKVILRMKQQGAVLLPPASVLGKRQHEAPRVMTPIEQAIDDNPRARGNPALRRRLNSFVESERKKGTDDGVIADRLRSWSDVTHDDDKEESAFD